MSERAGVPIAEVTANDFMQVRAALVRRLGGADRALVFSRIYYRTDHNSRVAVEVDGVMWWSAGHGLLAAETGLTEAQARAAVEALVDDGFVVRSKLKGNRYSYRPVVIGYLSDSPGTPEPVSDGSDRSTWSSDQVHLLDSAGVPLIDKEDVIDTPVVPTGTVAQLPVGRSPKITEYVGQLFEDAWTHWPRKESKKKARDRFLAVHDPRMVASKIKAHGDAHVLHTPTQFVPHLTTWLNQERWNDPLPTPRGDVRQAPQARAESVIEMGKRLAQQDSRKAVGA